MGDSGYAQLTDAPGAPRPGIDATVHGDRCAAWEWPPQQHAVWCEAPIAGCPPLTPNQTVLIPGFVGPRVPERLSLATYQGWQQPVHCLVDCCGIGPQLRRHEAHLWRPAFEPFRGAWADWWAAAQRTAQAHLTCAVKYAFLMGLIVLGLGLGLVSVGGMFVAFAPMLTIIISVMGLVGIFGGYPLQWRGLTTQHETLKRTLEHMVSVQPTIANGAITISYQPVDVSNKYHKAYHHFLVLTLNGTGPAPPGGVAAGAVMPPSYAAATQHAGIPPRAPPGLPSHATLHVHQ